MRSTSLDAERAELEAIRLWDLYFLLGETCSDNDFVAYCVRQVRRKQIVEGIYCRVTINLPNRRPSRRPSLQIGEVHAEHS